MQRVTSVRARSLRPGKMFASARKTRSCNDTPHSRPGLATFCFHNRWNNNTNRLSSKQLSTAKRKLRYAFYTSSTDGGPSFFNIYHSSPAKESRNVCSDLFFLLLLFFLFSYFSFSLSLFLSPSLPCFSTTATV